MEKYKNKLSVLGYCLALTLFTLSALASSSSQNVTKHVDDFVDGYNYGRNLFNDATDEIEYMNIDTIFTDADAPLLATIK